MQIPPFGRFAGDLPEIQMRPYGLYAKNGHQKNLEKSEFKWEFREVKYVIYSVGEKESSRLVLPNFHLMIFLA